MLLTLEQIKFLSTVAIEDSKGRLNVKEGLMDEDIKQLFEIDNLNYITNGEHLIANYKELKDAK